MCDFVRLFIHKNKTEAWQKLHRTASQKLDRSLTEALENFQTTAPSKQCIVYIESCHAKTILPDLSGLRTT